MSAHSEVVLIDHMGSDRSIVRAARVSYDRAPDGPGLYDHVAGSAVLSERDERLIKFLARHGHWTPFAHTALTFYIHAPVFVARQLAKHQVGLVWNEVSRRYIDSEPETYAFHHWRKRSPSSKQGSLQESVEDPFEAWRVYDAACERSNEAYVKLLELGVCQEQARAVLPVSTMTKWYWTGSLYAFHRICSLRSHATAQSETRDIVPYIGQACLRLFPCAWKALSEAKVSGEENT